MIKIAVYNRKGGTGKTTISVNLAGVFEKIHKMRVLVIDCDTQMNSTKFLLTNSTKPIRYTLADFFNNGISLSDTIVKCSFPVGVKKDGSLKENIDSDIHIIPIVETAIHVENIRVLKDALNEIDDQFDICILDCPPALSDESLAGICSADYIIVPAQADDDSLGGYQLLVNTVNHIRQNGYNLNLSILGVVMNNIAIHEAFDNYMFLMTKGGLKKDLFSSYLRRAAALRKARHFGMPISYFAPNEKIAQDFERLAEEVLTRIEIRK